MDFVIYAITRHPESLRYNITMAVSVAVCDIFNVKEWPDLETRSLEMVPLTDRIRV